MNYENQTKRQLIEECKRLKRMINNKENNYVLLEQDLDCLQQSIANYVEIVLYQRKEIERLNNIINEIIECIDSLYVPYEMEENWEFYGKEYDDRKKVIEEIKKLKGSDKE